MSQLWRNKRGNFKTLESHNNNVFKDILIGGKFQELWSKNGRNFAIAPKNFETSTPFRKILRKKLTQNLENQNIEYIYHMTSINM